MPQRTYVVRNQYKGNPDYDATGEEWDVSSGVTHLLDEDGDVTLCGIRIPDDGFSSGRWWWCDQADHYNDDELCTKCLTAERKWEKRWWK